jgi:hypothetical protein
MIPLIGASCVVLVGLVLGGLRQDYDESIAQDGEYRRRAAREGWGFDSFLRT